MRNVIFDLGGVVVRWNPDDILRRFYADDLIRGLVKRDVFQHSDWLEMDRGTLLEHDAVQRFHQRTGRSVSEMTALLQAVKESLQPISTTIELLHELSRQGVPLYCLSNMSIATAEYLRRQHTFFTLFRGVLISGEVKLVKPDPRIFAHIAERYDLTPAESIFVDDHAPNIESANRFGFNTILFRDSQQCSTELTALLRPLS